MKHHSERVPRKNMRMFNGRPLLHWILETLGRSRYIVETIINTDSEEIASLAANHFEVTIHMRPEWLCKITSDEANQILEYDLSLTEGRFFLQTHSTNPLLTTETVDRSIEAFFGQDTYDSLFSVTAVQKRFFWEDGRPVNHDPEKLIKTQELEPLLEENSCIYIFKRESFAATRNRIGSKPMLFRTDMLESFDIDEEEDFKLAESIMQKRVKP